MSRAKFEALAAQHGVTMNYTAGGRHRRTGEIVPYELDLDAPEGQAFKSSGCSTDSSLHGGVGETAPNWPMLLGALAHIISLGFEPDTEEL